MFIFSTIGIARDISKWKVFCGDRITVEATVTGNERYHGKNRDYFKPIVSYTVNGVQYNDVTVDDGSVSLTLPSNIGTPRSVTVDGKNPRRILRDPNCETLIFGALGFFCGTFALAIKKSKLSDY